MLPNISPMHYVSTFVSVLDESEKVILKTVKMMRHNGRVVV